MEKATEEKGNDDGPARSKQESVGHGAAVSQWKVEAIGFI